MTPCTGCVHLRHGRTFEVCAAQDRDYTYTVNPYTGRRIQNPLGFRPTVDTMRHGACGPDAKLYRPRWWMRLWRRLR